MGETFHGTRLLLLLLSLLVEERELHYWTFVRMYLLLSTNKQCSEMKGINVESRLLIMLGLSKKIFGDLDVSFTPTIHGWFWSSGLHFRNLKSVYTSSLLLYQTSVIILSFFGLLLGFRSDARGCGRQQVEFTSAPASNGNAAETN
jgi:hypothetical protein